ncbi:hypothetical protein AURDEDRAFT_183288 [Auricularia subglabra TFB-10046 SS5]|nr:hypothetical protein AURDEDRAFT_183288 [Auricularia subglabra TFB-10046 SS5]
MGKLGDFLSCFPSLSDLALGGSTLLHVNDWKISSQRRHAAVRFEGGCRLRLSVDPDARLLEKMLIWAKVHAISLVDIYIDGVPALDEAFLQRIQALPSGSLSDYLTRVTVLELVQLGNTGFESYGLADIFRRLHALEVFHLSVLVPFQDLEGETRPVVSALAAVLAMDVTPCPASLHTFALSFESSAIELVDDILQDAESWETLDEALALPKWAGLRKLLVASFGPWDSTTQGLLRATGSMPRLCQRNAAFIQILGPDYAHDTPAARKHSLASALRCAL